MLGSLLRQLLPRSLGGRLYALYAGTLLLFVGAGLSVFYKYQFAAEIEAAQLRAESLIAVVAPTVSDSVVIGDYDTVRRTLERAIHHSSFESALYIDLKGGRVEARRTQPVATPPPLWLTRIVEERLYDTNQTIVVGGRDYGILRLHFAPDHIAGALWQQARLAMTLAGISLAGGLVMIRLLLVRWLKHLDRLDSHEEQIRSGVLDARTLMSDDAPLEFRRTFEVLNRTAASLQAQREEAVVTLAAIADAVLTADAAGRVILANPAAETLFAQPATALIGQRLEALLPTLFENQPPLQPWSGRRMQLHLHDGTPHVVNTTLSLVAGPEGQPVGQVLAMGDVTAAHELDQRLRAELEARQNALAALRVVLLGLRGAPGPTSGPDEDDLEVVTQLISDLVRERESTLRELDQQKFALDQHAVVSVTDLQGRILYANDRFCEISGYARAELIGQTHRVVASGMNSPTLYRDMWSTIQQGQVWQGELCNRSKNGSLRWFSSTLVPLLDADDRPHRYISICTDITERRAAQARVQEHSEQLDAIFNLSPDGFVSFDSQGHVNYVSPAFQRLTGIDEHDILGASDEAVAHRIDAQCTPTARLRDLQTGEARKIEVQWPAKRVLVASVQDSSGQQVSRVLHLRDVTHETEVDRMKSEFLSTAAHELRTPMVSIYGFTELLLSRQMTPERQKDLLKTVYRQSELMISIINELLDLARIEARRGQDFVLEHHDLNALVRNVCDSFKVPTGRQAPALELDDGVALVHADRQKMQQALTNVLSNAYKYSPEGGPVTIRVRREAAPRGVWRVEIEDQGIGMTPEQLARVGERFYRADASGAIPGTGLGVSIVKEIMQLHGGTLQVHSQPGRTVVSLTLPVVAPAAAPRALAS